MALGLAAAVIAVGAVANAAATDRFEPEARLSKGWFGVLTYKFIRDEVPGGQAALAQCDKTPRFSDLADQSPFKSDALHCLASLGYFDEVPLSDGRLPGWKNRTATAAEPPGPVTTQPPTSTTTDPAQTTTTTARPTTTTCTHWHAGHPKHTHPGTNHDGTHQSGKCAGY